MSTVNPNNASNNGSNSNKKSKGLSSNNNTNRKSQYTPLSPLQFDKSSASEIKKSIKSVYDSTTDLHDEFNSQINKDAKEYYKSLSKMSGDYWTDYATQGIGANNDIITLVRSQYSEMDRLSKDYWDTFTSRGQSAIASLNGSTIQINGTVNTSNLNNSSNSNNSLSNSQDILDHLSDDSSSTDLSDLADALLDDADIMGDLGDSLSDGADAMGDMPVITSRILKDVGSKALSLLANLANEVIDLFSDASKKYYQLYEDSYHELYVSQNWTDRSDYFITKNEFVDYIKENKLSWSTGYDEMIETLKSVSSQGYMGEDAVTKSISDTLSKKMVPWMNTTSEAYLNLYDRFGSGFDQVQKGMHLQLKQSKEGTKLLERGVIANLLDKIYPSLVNIDSNTAEDMTANLARLAEGLKSVGYTDSAISSITSDIMDVVEGSTDHMVLRQAMINSGVYNGTTLTDESNTEAWARFAEIMADNIELATGSSTDNIITKEALSGYLGNNSWNNNTNVGSTSDNLRELSEYFRSEQSAISNEAENISSTLNDVLNSDNMTESYTPTETALTKISNWASGNFILDKILENVSFGSKFLASLPGLIAGQFGNLIKWISQSGGIQSALSNLGSSISSLSSSAGSLLSGLGSKIGSLASGAGSAIVGGLGSVGSALGSGAATAGGLALAGGSGILGGILGGAGLIAGGVDIYRAITGKGKDGTELSGKDRQDKAFSGAAKVELVGAGAAAGAAIGSVIPGLGTAIGALVGAGAGGIGALLGGSKIGEFLSDQWDGFKEKAGPVWESVKEKASDTWEVVKDKAGKAWNSVSDVASNLMTKYTDSWKAKINFAVGLGDKTMNKLFSAFGKDWEETKSNISDLWSNFKDKASNAWDSVKSGASNIVDSIGNKFSGIWDSVKESATNIWDGVTTYVSDKWDTVTEKASNTFESISNKVSNIYDGITDFAEGVADSVSNAWDSVTGAVSDTWDSVTGAVSDTWDSITGWFNDTADAGEKITGLHTSNSYASGCEYVPEDDHLAYLHKGEKVLTANDSDLLRTLANLGYDSTKYVNTSDYINKGSPSIEIVRSVSSESTVDSVDSTQYDKRTLELLAAINKGFNTLNSTLIKLSRDAEASSTKSSLFGSLFGDYDPSITPN